MKIYGYTKENEFVQLKEATLECSLEEIKCIANFLKYADVFHNSENCRNEYCHSHYRDWCDKFDEKSSDLIVITNINKCK